VDEEFVPEFEEPVHEDEYYVTKNGETNSDHADEEEALLSKQLSRSGSKSRIFANKKPTSVLRAPKSYSSNKASPAKGIKDSSSKRKRLHNKPKQREFKTQTSSKNHRGPPQSGRIQSSSTKQQRNSDNGTKSIAAIQHKSYAAAVADGQVAASSAAASDIKKKKKSFVVQRLLTHDDVRRQQDDELLRPRSSSGTPNTSMDEVPKIGGRDFWAAFAKPCEDSDRPLLVASLAQPDGKSESDVDTLFAAELGGISQDLIREDSRPAPMHWIELKGVTLASLPESLLPNDEYNEAPSLVKMIQPLRMVGLDLTGSLLRRHREVLEPVATLAKTLRCLDVSSLGIRNLPASWAQLECLVCLRASHNQLRSWPDDLFTFRHERRRISNDHVSSKDEGIFSDEDEDELTLEITPLGMSLKHLDLSTNVLTELPASIGLLSRITWLDVSTNHIGYVDDRIFTAGSVPKLRRLDLSNNNHLQELGSTVAEFLTRPARQPSEILLSNCAELHTPPSNIAELGTAAIVRFYTHYHVADEALDRRRHRAYLARRDALWLEQIREIEHRSLLRETEATDEDCDIPLPPRLRSWNTLSSSNGGCDTVSVAESYLPQESEYEGGSISCFDAVDGGQRIASLVLRLELEIKHYSEISNNRSLARRSFPSSGKLHEAKKTNSSNIIPRTVSDSQVPSTEFSKEEESLSSRLLRARNDLDTLKRILKRLACDERQALEVFACFCAPRAVEVKQPNRPPITMKLDESHQLQLMRELKAMIEAVPAPQREIVPAARFPDDILNALLRRQSTRNNGKTLSLCKSPRGIIESSDDDTDLLGPLISQNLSTNMLTSPQFAGAKKYNWTEPLPLKPRIFHFAGHCVRFRGAAPSLVFSQSVDIASTDDERRSDNSKRSRRRVQLGDIAKMPNLDEFLQVVTICDGLECLFLNACNSSIIGEKIIDRLGHTGIRIICWKTRVADIPASHFARYFYEQIGNNPCIDVRKAYKNALEHWKTNFKLGDPGPLGTNDIEENNSIRPHGIPCFLKPKPSQLAASDDARFSNNANTYVLPPPISHFPPPASRSS